VLVAPDGFRCVTFPPTINLAIICMQLG
jgi:hypothetical protein